MRARLAVQVDANVGTRHDRSRLASNDDLGWFTAGVRHHFGLGWSAAAEWLYVPLSVRRPPDFSTDREPLSSVRIQLRYAAD